MTSSSSAERRQGVLPQVSISLAIAVLSALSWFAWLGWDDEYQVDPRTGVSSGPYEAWQVIGCALTLLVLLVGAILAGAQPLLGSAALTVGFTKAWALHAAAADETGLYMVGMVMLLVGLGTAAVLVASATHLVRGRFVARH